MKAMALFLMVTTLTVSTAFGQTYVEITEAGWGPGIGYSAPLVVDLDGDGLLDLLIGEGDGTLSHFRQESPGSATFSLMAYDFNDIDVGTGAKPSATDLDGDGLLNLIIGDGDGSLHHYEQEEAGNAVFMLISEAFSGIHVGDGAAPAFTDLDTDGLLDLIVGTDDGPIRHYEQDGSGSQTFVLVSDSLSGVDVWMRSTPSCADLDDDGLLDLLIGDQAGDIVHYEQADIGSLDFTLISESFSEINVESKSAPYVTDLDDDNLLDLLIGKANGNLHHYEQDVGSPLTFGLVTEWFLAETYDRGEFSSPRLCDLDSDGLLDMIVGLYEGHLLHYEQDEIGSARFNSVSDCFNDINVGSHAGPCFTDLDADGLLDMVVGSGYGMLSHFEQEAMGSTSFALRSDTLSGIVVGYEAKPAFADLDGDNLLDLLVGESDGNLNHYEQDAVGSASFLIVTEIFNDIDVGGRSAPVFTDVDDDGLLDLIVGTNSHALERYEQDGPNSYGFTLSADQFAGVSVGIPKPSFADINNDGLFDLIVGENHGGVCYFQRQAGVNVGEDTPTPRSLLVPQSVPNPFSKSTTISFYLPESSSVNISILDLLGRRIRSFEKHHQSGFCAVSWDGNDTHGHAVRNGLYICRIQFRESDHSLRLILVR